MTEVKFNLNEYVKVRLSPDGQTRLHEYRSSIKPDAEGYYKMQAWEFMQIFGPVIVFGTFPVFQTEIILCLP